MAYFGTELKSAKIIAEELRKHIEVVVCRKRLKKNAEYWKNDKILKSGKNGHIAWAKAKCKSKCKCKCKSKAKWPFLGRNLKVPKS